MKTIKLTVVLGLLVPLTSQAGEIIVHPSLELAAADVREVFLGDKQLAGGIKLLPVDNATLQTDFAAKVLQIDLTKYTSVWTKKAFREGLAAPSVKGSDAEVSAFVKATPGAVGYVGAAPAGAKVLQKF